ncbi:MAG TPA: hypothetical protein VK668_19355 [Mucilaginibacter sp.]|nr:hypothetical protein [Mucilaginibacter sp.]
MNVIRQSTFRLNVLVVTLFFLSACNTTTDPFTKQGFDVYDAQLRKRVATYNDFKSPNSANTKKGNPALYIDFSAGINNAFKDPVISRLMSECFNTVLADKFDVFKLGSNQITPFAINNTTELGQKVSDPREYLDIWAPIQAAVEKITNADNDALLITDFEEWQNKTEITNTAYLKIPFSKWLTKGNTIHFFIADYKQGAIDKHIYFTIFNCGTPNSSSLITKLESKLAPLNARFDLSTKAYKLSTDYPSDREGGLFYDKNAKTEKQKNILDLKDSYVNGLKNGNFYEFYPLGLDWKTINETHDAYKGQNQFNDLFRNLFIDLSNEDCYSYENFDVMTYDISIDFVNYSRSIEVVNHKPKLTKGNNGEPKVADEEKDAIALGCYNPDGSVKDEWKYKPVSPTAVPDFFLLNKQLFKNTKSGDIKKAEFGISFDPKFKLKDLPDPNGLLKIDIVLNTAEPKVDNPKLNKFKWINAKGVPNIGLYESIKNTMQELKPTNKVIYSYYIKTNQ